MLLFAEETVRQAYALLMLSFRQWKYNLLTNLNRFDPYSMEYFQITDSNLLLKIQMLLDILRSISKQEQ